MEPLETPDSYEFHIRSAETNATESASSAHRMAATMIIMAALVFSLPMQGAVSTLVMLSGSIASSRLGSLRGVTWNLSTTVPHGPTVGDLLNDVTGTLMSLDLMNPETDELTITTTGGVLIGNGILTHVLTKRAPNARFYWSVTKKVTVKVEQSLQVPKHSRMTPADAARAAAKGAQGGAAQVHNVPEGRRRDQA